MKQQQQLNTEKPSHLKPKKQLSPPPIIKNNVPKPKPPPGPNISPIPGPSPNKPTRGLPLKGPQDKGVVPGLPNNGPGWAHRVVTRSQSVTKKPSRSESLVESLRAEVLELKEEVERVSRCNVELRVRNESLVDDLATALAKIHAFESHEKTEEKKGLNFKAMQLLVASKLEKPRVSGEPVNGRGVDKPVVHRKIPETASCARPPPPPPPPVRGIATRKASSVEELYHSLAKRVVNQNSPKNGNFSKPCVSSAHSSIVGEIQNRSAHLLAIKSDIETKGEFINGLIEKVLSASFTDIEDVASFVDWIDGELLCLADERGVLKHFKWPEKKADAMREAAIEYRSLKLLESEISSYNDDSTVSYGVALKKMASLLDKSEKCIQRLTTLRNSVMRSYQDHKIPTDWMLDSGAICKIKTCSRELAKKYVDRLMKELRSIRHSEKESTQESLLLQGVHFAYRAQQIAGGLDSETLCAFEEMRRWIPSGNPQGSQELLLAGIPSA